jgi:hypothetical protein
MAGVKEEEMEKHSKVDAITNSSMDIHLRTTDQSIDRLKGMLARLLASLDVTKPVDSVFEISRGLDDIVIRVKGTQTDVSLFRAFREIFELEVEYNG